MPPKTKKQKLIQKAPEELIDLIKNAASAAFPEKPEVAQNIKVVVSNFGAIDFQFIIKPIAIRLNLDCIVVLNKIIDNLQENQLIQKIEISDNETYVNIFTKVSRQRPCRSCQNHVKLGRQPMRFKHQNLFEQLTEELSMRFSRLSIGSQQRRDVTLAEKICENFQILLGGNEFINDIKKAVESIAKRDYPELDLDKIPPIIVPEVFLANHPEAVDYKVHIQELKKQKDFFDIRRAGDLKNEMRTRSLTGEELELVEKLKKVRNLEHIVGEYAEKQIYHFLKDCIKDDEVVVINNFKIMTLKDLDEVAKDCEKDYVILNLSKRSIMSLEVKANCNDWSFRSAKKQIEQCKELIENWCGGELTEENGWSFYPVIYFQHKSEDFSFCDNCSKFIIHGEEFKQKFENIINEMPVPPPGTETKAREEFKIVVKALLFLASYEPIITPAKITDEVVKMLKKAGTLENIIYWNKILCLTPNQLSLLNDTNLKKVILLSPPSCGKTMILKGKAKQFASKGQPVLFILPFYEGLKSLLFFQLLKEFEEYSDFIKLENVQADHEFCFNEKDLIEMMEKYENHHIIMDEVAIGHFFKKNIALIQKIAYQCQSVSFWLSLTYIKSDTAQERIMQDLENFHFIKDELNIPLRNTALITQEAYNLNGGNSYYKKKELRQGKKGEIYA